MALGGLLKNTEEKYLEAGTVFAFDVVNKTYLIDSEEYREHFENWKELEERYVGEGFNPISLDTFIDFFLAEEKGEHFPIERFAGKKSDGKQVLHSHVYQKFIMGNEKNHYEMGTEFYRTNPEMLGGKKVYDSQTKKALYVRAYPSTEDIIKKKGL